MREFLYLWIPKNAGKSLFKHTIAKELSCARWPARGLSPEQERESLDDFPNKGSVTIVHMDVGRMLETNIMDRQYYDSLYKFCFVRNPWDRFVSLFHYLGRDKLKLHDYTNFDDFVRHVERKGVPPIGLYKKKGMSLANPQSAWVNCEIDYIGRVETLQEDFDHICENIGCARMTVPVEHKGKRRNTRYQEYYTRETRDTVGEVYREDVENFSYSFE
jgi:hypothetical protein